MIRAASHNGGRPFDWLGGDTVALPHLSAQRSVGSKHFSRIPRISALSSRQRGPLNTQSVMARRRESARRLFLKAERADTDEQDSGVVRGVGRGDRRGRRPIASPLPLPGGRHVERKQRYLPSKTRFGQASAPSQGRAPSPRASGACGEAAPPPLPA
jgi:hypothetical protein